MTDDRWLVGIDDIIQWCVNIMMSNVNLLFSLSLIMVSSNVILWRQAGENFLQLHLISLTLSLIFLYCGNIKLNSFSGWSLQACSSQEWRHGRLALHLHLAGEGHGWQAVAVGLEAGQAGAGMEGGRRHGISINVTSRQAGGQAGRTEADHLWQWHAVPAVCFSGDSDLVVTGDLLSPELPPPRDNQPPC